MEMHDQRVRPVLARPSGRCYIFAQYLIIEQYPHPSPETSPLSSAPSLSSVSSSSSSSVLTALGSPQKNFTARFQHKRAAPDELLEFWSSPQEDFDTVYPLQWWLGRRAQFTRLYRLAHDIFSIPGMLLFITSQYDNQ